MTNRAKAARNSKDTLTPSGHRACITAHSNPSAAVFFWRLISMTRSEGAQIKAYALDESPAHVSLRDRAYDEIKRRINRLQFRPGAYLNEAQISATLGI